ncbi:MAG: hypothetical protein M3M99_05115 [Actinomycetota bacterium]|nr:hypothetical protein [Actinomycetota bacterium]
MNPNIATRDHPAPERRDWFNELVQERLGERRFYSLAAAVREHEGASREGDGAPHDQALYARLRLICGEL